MKKFSVIDMHCDTMTGLCRSGKDFRDNDCHISLKKMAKGNYLMQCFAMFLYLERTPEPFKQCNIYIDYFDKIGNYRRRNTGKQRKRPYECNADNRRRRSH